MKSYMHHLHDTHLSIGIGACARGAAMERYCFPCIFYIESPPLWASLAPNIGPDEHHQRPIG